MLEIASATTSIPNTRRLHPPAPSLQDAADATTRRPASLRLDLDLQPVAGRRVFDQDDTVRTSNQPLSAGNDPLDGHLQAFANKISFPPLLHGTLNSSRFEFIRMRLPWLWPIIVHVAIEAKEIGPLDDR